MIIGDSNTKYIKEQLINMSNIEIHHLHAFTLEQAEELTTTIQDKDFNNTTTYLLVGTNNIKKGESAKDCAAKHKAIKEKIKNITQDLVIIQLPPIYCRDYRKQREMDREIIRMNTILEERHQNIISTQFMEENRNLIQQDGLHLTNQAAMDIATAIMQSAHPTRTSPTRTPRTITTQQEEMKITIHQNQQQDQQEEEIEVIETSYRGAAIVIGAKGNRVRLLKAKYVDIDREKLEGGEYALIIRGKTEDTKRARLEINNIIKEETQRHNNFTYNTTCRFFKMGMCNRGNQCKYLHTNDPVDISPRTPDRHQQEEQHTPHYPTTLKQHLREDEREHQRGDTRKNTTVDTKPEHQKEDATTLRRTTQTEDRIEDNKEHQNADDIGPQREGMTDSGPEHPQDTNAKEPEHHQGDTHQRGENTDTTRKPADTEATAHTPTPAIETEVNPVHRDPAHTAAKKPTTETEPHTEQRTEPITDTKQEAEAHWTSTSWTTSLTNSRK